ncbi:MAG TPA: hypothetical protein VLL25_10400 [Acidimicrobiales bacterium]|nr:hypothetical protein [Acidimicrobiales bacterium]
MRVDVEVKADGSGTVTVTAQLDQEAAQSVPDLAAELRTADLVQAGWRVDGPRPVVGGGLLVAASKPFRTPAEAEQVIAEISGPNGPFHDLHISRQRSLLATRTTVRGTIDLTCGLQCFSDPALQQQLAGANLGSGTFAFGVAVHLPGKTASWQPKLGEKTPVMVSSRMWDGTRIVLLLVGAAVVVLVLIGLGVVAVGRRRRHRGPRRGLHRAR